MPPKIVVPPAETDSQRIAALIDELGGLEKQIAPHKPAIARIEVLRKSLQAHFAKHPAHQSTTAEGKKYSLHASARKMASLVDAAKLFARLPKEIFFALARFALQDIEKHCAADVRAAAVSLAQTGPRVLTVIEKGK